VRARAATVFLNTHLLSEAEQVCDRVTVIDRGRSVVTGALAELLGGRTTVRLLVTGLPDRWWLAHAAFWLWSRDGPWTVLETASDDVVPDLVGAIVQRGGRVTAVVPEHQSLEERFLELLGEP